MGRSELSGRNVAALGAACASRVPPDAAEVPEAALGDRVVQLRAALGVELAARGHEVTGVDMRDLPRRAGTAQERILNVEWLLHEDAADGEQRSSNRQEEVRQEARR